MILDRTRWLTAFVLLLLSRFSLAWMNERPVLEVRDGNLFITSAVDKNITLQSRGSISFVNVNGMNLLQIATSIFESGPDMNRGASSSNFTINYISHRCGGVLSGPSHKISTPTNVTYPIDCIWHMNLPVMFDIGTRAICESDNLQISDRSPQGTVISSKTYCGEDNSATHLSTQGKVSVKYKTSVNNGGTGWIIGFEAQQHRHSEDFYSSHYFIID